MLNLLDMKMNRVNLGEIVRQLVEGKGLSKAEFAKSIGIQRQNIEKTVFAKHSLDTDMVCKINEVLDCNLFDYYAPGNKNDYVENVVANLTIRMGSEAHDKTFVFQFGKNNVEIK